MSSNVQHFWLLLAVSVVATCVVHWFSSRYVLAPEIKRKLLHVLAGTIGLTMPWLFDRSWPVFLLCGILFASIAAVRWHVGLRSRLGGDLYDVGRRSIGELLLPISISILFWLADGNKALYVIPLLIVTTADVAAALGASRYGLTPYPTVRGQKTWEGTFIFLSVAFVATIAPLLLLSNVGRAEVLLISFLIGMIGCIIEATTWSGVDNLFIPLGTYFALKRFMEMSVSALALELAVVISMTVIAVAWAPRTRLTAQANLAAVLVAFVLWAVGGPAWVAPALLAFLLHPLLTRFPSQTPDTIDPRAVFSVSSCSVIWMALNWFGLLSLRASLYPCAVGLVAHLCMISLARRREVDSTNIPWQSHVCWAIVATTVVMSSYVVIFGIDGRVLVQVIAASTLALLASASFNLLPIRPTSGRRWVLQALFALMFSVAGFVVQQMPTAVNAAVLNPQGGWSPSQLECSITRIEADSGTP